MVLLNIFPSLSTCTHRAPIVVAMALAVALSFVNTPVAASEPAPRWKIAEMTINGRNLRPMAFGLRSLASMEPLRTVRAFTESTPRVRQQTKYQNRQSSMAHADNANLVNKYRSSAPTRAYIGSPQIRSAPKAILYNQSPRVQNIFPKLPLPQIPSRIKNRLNYYTEGPIASVARKRIYADQSRPVYGRIQTGPVPVASTQRRKEPMAIVTRDRGRLDSAFGRSRNKGAAVGAVTGPVRAAKVRDGSGCSGQHLDEFFALPCPGVALIKSLRSEGLPLPEALQSRWRLIRARSGNIEPILEALGLSGVKKRVVAGYNVVDDLAISGTVPQTMTNTLHMPLNNKRSTTIRLDCQEFSIADADVGHWTATAGVVDKMHLTKMEGPVGKMYDARIVLGKDPEGIHSGRVQLQVWILIPAKTGKVLSATNWWHCQN